jgi:hypothetical protein
MYLEIVLLRNFLRGAAFFWIKDSVKIHSLVFLVINYELLGFKGKPG